jgi:DNA-directed RNA polymerase specialized sigma24 family protein
MGELRHALNGADPTWLRELAGWFRKQAQSCDTLADYADWERHQSSRTAEHVALCRAGRYNQAAAIGAPPGMIDAWRALNDRRTRRRQIEQRGDALRALLAAGFSQRKIARQLGLSLGRVNQLAQEARRCSPASPPQPSPPRA